METEKSMYLLNRIKGMLVLLVFLTLTSADASLITNIGKGSNETYNSLVGGKLEICRDCRKEGEYKFIKYNPYTTNRCSVSYEKVEESKIGVKSLPAVPRALLMGVIGFTCVSLVRDRRFWINILIGLVWAGQTGLNVIPDIISNLRNERKVLEYDIWDFKHCYLLDNDKFISGRIDDSNYIGLLRFLAGIPDSLIALQSKLFISISLYDRYYISNSFESSSQPYSKNRDTVNFNSSNTDKFTFLLIDNNSVFKSNINVYVIKQYIYLPQFFDFQRFPRGPPDALKG